MSDDAETLTTVTFTVQERILLARVLASVAAFADSTTTETAGELLDLWSVSSRTARTF
jgi:hypothetical protein